MLTTCTVHTLLVALNSIFIYYGRKDLEMYTVLKVYLICLLVAKSARAGSTRAYFMHVVQWLWYGSKFSSISNPGP